MKRLVSMMMTLILALNMFPTAALAVQNDGQPDQPEAVSVETTEETGSIHGDTRWSYLDNGSDPAGDPAAEGYVRTSWTAVDFDDSSWETSKASLGAKRGQIGSVDGYTPEYLLNQYKEDGSTNVEAFFFRTKVHVAEASAVKQILGTVVYDDSATVYINGVKVAGFDDSEITANLQYGGHNSSTAEGEINITDQDVIQSVLKDGDNVVAVEVHQGRASSSDIYFDMPSLEFRSEVYKEPVIQSNISLSVGSNQTEMNFTWHVNTEETGTLLIAKNDELADGAMPENATTVSAVSTVNNDSQYTNKAVATGLQAGTTYAYQIVNGDVKSEIRTFTTDDGGAFSFAYVADPQIGASGNADSDTTGWEKTLNIIGTNQLFSGVSFLLSAGDQVNAASSEDEYDRYLDHDALGGLPVATVIGNHDSSSDAYNQHFNVANESVEYGASTLAGGDSWFVYNNVLFMVLNTNDLSAAEHRDFMEEAIAANPHVDWKVVAFHQSIYTVASHYNNDGTDRRETLTPIFKELDIDVVLQGHDHVYCRTYMMDGLDVSANENYTYGNGQENAPTAVTDPEGILYITANSGSGSKHYNIVTNVEFPYAAVQNQERIPNASRIDVTENAFTITTFRTTDMTVVDAFTINRTPQKTLTDISVTTQPAKVTYTEGETFDPAGMVVTAAYSDGTREAVTDYTIAPDGALTPADESVTVAYQGKTATVPVTVNQAVVDINTTSDTGLVEYLSSYSTGNTNADGGVAEIVKFNEDNDCMYLVSGQTQTLDIVTVNADGSTELVKKIDVAALGAANGFSAGDITSVDVNTARDLVAIAVQNADYTANGAIVLLDYEGNFVDKYETGVQPDMITFTPDGSKVLTANEGEPREGYGEGTTDPMGSVTVVDLDAKTVTTCDFTSLDNNRAKLVRNGVLLKTGTAPSVDLEPEFIAVSADSKTAYVTLQENNAIGALDLTTGTWQYVKGLGFKDHSAEGNGLDQDQDGKIDIRSENVYGVYMPDGISVVTIGGQDYLITANEGDAREWGEYENIDSDKLILADGEEAGKKIEFLDTAKTDGLTTGKTYILGGRSFSIWNADTLQQVFDSGDDFETITAKEFPNYFNSGHDEAGLDKRSHKKGVEPETISVLKTNGKTYAVVGLERMGGIVVYDITNPAKASYADYLNVRGFSEVVTDLSRLGDLGPEGICTIPAENSPTGNAMLLVANEVSGTVTVAQIEKTASNEGPSSSPSAPTSYAVSLEDMENGSVTASSKSAAKGSTVTLTVTPDEGYELADLTVTDKSGKELTLTQKGDGVYTFTMPASKVTVSADFQKSEAPVSQLPFTDVAEKDWFYDGVSFVYENGIMNGLTTTTFGPSAATTRSMVVTMLWRMEDQPQAGSDAAFADVKEGAYYAQAIDWAAENGIVNGTSDTTFAPDQSVTRQQLAAILYRYSQYKGYDVTAQGDLTTFGDWEQVSDYAVEAMEWAVGSSLIQGIDDNLVPGGSATRAQLATIFSRFITNFGS
ncbi:MAG: choice-of-anchor I family protein [Ruminiclostridium sp.]|nr:choice-of-anchor I family protein [Ruminiclostridium sp.]